MVLAILNWILMLFMIVFQAVWIHSILNHDGKCHYTDCKHCFYDGWCPIQEERRKHHDRNNRNE